MAADAETVWRKALAGRGRDWVMAELKRRSGRPDDVVLDVVFEEPHPTREFCQRWCGDQDNKIFVSSWHTTMFAVLVIVLVSSAWMAISSRTPDKQSGETNFAAAPVQPFAPVPTDQGASQSASSTNQDASQSTLPTAPDTSECAYMTYETANCRAPQYP